MGTNGASSGATNGIILLSISIAGLRTDLKPVKKSSQKPDPLRFPRPARPSHFPDGFRLLLMNLS